QQTIYSPARRSIAPWKTAPRQLAARDQRGEHERAAQRDGERSQRSRVGRIAALLKREQHDAERFGAGRPQQRRHGKLVERSEKDEQRAGGGGGRDERKDDGGEAPQQPRARDLRGFLERPVELVVAA